MKLLRIYLTEAQIAKCEEFSRECAKQQQQIEFGQSDTKKRSIQEIFRDNMIGKIAEVAVANFIETKYDISIELDFNYYPRLVWDDEDTVINGWKIDIKGTRQGGKWMLIEWSKLSFRKAEKNLPHLFFMLSVGWDRKNDKPTGFADLEGYFPTRRLIIGEKNVSILKKGTFIPNTLCQLQADNFGVPFINLYQNWDELVDAIERKEPYKLDDYYVPD